MEEIKKRVLIASGIVEIKKNKIPIVDLINYTNAVEHTLRKNGYIVEKVEEHDILSFFQTYSPFGNCLDKNVFITNTESVREKLNKYILNNISDEIKKLLRLEVKYNIPIIFEDNIIVYSVFSNDEIQDKLKSILYYDSFNNAYLVSLKNISYEEVLERIIENSTKTKKSTLEVNEILDFKEKIDALIEPKYDNIKYAFKLDIDKDKLFKYSNYINKYYISAKENTEYLNENNNIKTLLSVLKRKM